VTIQHLSLEKPNKNVDSSSLTGSFDTIQDGYIDEMAAIHSRPGLEVLFDVETDTQIDGLFWSNAMSMLFIVSAERIFVKREGAAITDVTGAGLNRGTKVTFAEAKIGAKTYMFMANGGRIVYTDGLLDTEYIVDEACPLEVTHVAFVDAYLIANSLDTSSWYYSTPNNPLEWSVTQSYDAEMKIDNIEGLLVANKTIYLLGKDSIEQWQTQPVGADPFRRLVSSSIDSGVFSPYAVSLSNGRLVFLDKRRRLVMMEGNALRPLSMAYDKVLQNIEYANDAAVDSISIDGRNFFMLTFPSAKKTFVYDETVGAWYEWGRWNGDRYLDFIASNYTHARDWNLHLMASKSTGKIYQLSSDYHTDDEEPIRTRLLTGHVNYGSDMTLKSSKGFVLRIKRGVGKYKDKYKKPYLLVRKRDNNKSQFGPYKKVDLGAIGENSIRKAVYRRGGKYFSRQYEIVLPDSAPLVISGAWENVDGAEVR